MYYIHYFYYYSPSALLGAVDARYPLLGSPGLTVFDAKRPKRQQPDPFAWSKAVGPGTPPIYICYMTQSNLFDAVWNSHI